jgi:hypothetical protein
VGGNSAKVKKYVANPEWLANNTEPKQIDKIMKHKGTPWHWCSPKKGGKCAGKWCKHKPSECKGILKHKESKKLR